MKILVTGGAGFIGSHLCKSLLDKNHSVICVDNLVSGSLNNINELSKSKKFTFLNFDITDLPVINDRLDYVLNLACPASPVDYKYLPVETLLTCSTGTKNMLDLAVKNKAKFLHTSTSEVYGNPLEHPQKESYWGNVNSIGDRSCYDEGKRFAESLIVNYGVKYGLDYKIVRIFNTYGPNMRASDGRVVSNFINQALRNEPITIYGKGTQTRSFCYVDDMIEGILKMMNSKERGPINLGNPNELTIGKIAKLVIKLTKSKSKIAREELPKDDPIRRKPDITLAKKLLRWGPAVPIEVGLIKTINYFANI